VAHGAMHIVGYVARRVPVVLALHCLPPACLLCLLSGYAVLLLTHTCFAESAKSKSCAAVSKLGHCPGLAVRSTDV
jgi:hypothetical protein